mmetsp:Transcript_26326/g.43711  ORF Transcript_26326/g.43711 Transcript_26326/m.43711 type:complete len:281 (-) Transcript_26326:169-1011(-)|eukprot:CAMPEP_0119315726 /NCGR_PEP_ID=MMETSP1333-20130426/36914_1 /TAXON_ID=418940 /ORGANISM="Scyphosphaera apsteinii, Strain RCC1455" /LENGTH=280 /DNA_ID=CAMNT_0007321171 /DNA_START=64 /DNA_END=906 /DNA_ORIENTATION=+
MGLLGRGWHGQCDADEGLKVWLLLGLFAWHCTSHWLCRGLLGRFSFPLTGRTKREGRFVVDTAYNIQGFLLHSFCGPLALYLSWKAARPSPFTPVWPVVEDSQAPGCEVAAQAQVMGAAHTAWVLFQTLYTLTGNEHGWDNYLHHALLLLIAVLSPLNNICGELILFGLAMEVSTPFLNVMIVMRCLEGFTAVADAASVLFAVAFIGVRVGYFGWGLWRSIAFWWLNPKAFVGPRPDVVGRLGPIACLHAILSTLYILQLFWSRMLMKKIVGKLRKQLID